MENMQKAVAVAAAVWLVAVSLGAQQPPRASGLPSPSMDRIARLRTDLESRPLRSDPQTGFLRAVLEALNIPAESQLLVFSKTGVQHAFTGPRTPRALYFDESTVVGYVPGAPAIEIVTHDPVEGLAFYTLDQNVPSPLPVRRTSCLTCHESVRTYDVPGLIVRSHTVDSDGNLIQNRGGVANAAIPVNHNVDHTVSHPDRWGGWLVTSEGEAPPYAQRAHQGNITFSAEGNTSSQVFIEWMASAPESRGYLSEASDIVSLLTFDHQMPAINLMTRANFQWRRAAGEGTPAVDEPSMRAVIDELADYLLLANEAPLLVPLTARAGFARALEARMPHDGAGRSLGQLDGVNRLLRYSCSYMVYSDAFAALPPPIQRAVYRRLIAVLSQSPGDRRFPYATAANRLATLEILRATVPDFPKS